jgi:hypothetical protein
MSSAAGWSDASPVHQGRPFKVAFRAFKGPNATSIVRINNKNNVETANAGVQIKLDNGLSIWDASASQYKTAQLPGGTVLNIPTNVWFSACVELTSWDNGAGYGLATLSYDVDGDGICETEVYSGAKISGLTDGINAALFVPTGPAATSMYFDDVQLNWTFSMAPKSCTELQAMGYDRLMPMDINHDCQIDFKEFSVIAKKWMQCNVPGFEAGCL